MDLINYIIEQPVTINNEYTTAGPVIVQWFAGAALVTNPALDKIKINDRTFVLRAPPKEPPKKEGITKLKTVLGHARITKKDESYIAVKDFRPTPTDLELPFAFLQCVQYGDYENARGLLSFDITDTQLRDYFGEFEVLLNNYLDTPTTVSILPKGSNTAKNFSFEIKDSKITNIT